MKTLWKITSVMASVLRKTWKDMKSKMPSAFLSLERRQAIKDAKREQSAARKTELLRIRKKKREYFDLQRQKEEEKKMKKKRMKLLSK